MAIKAVLWDVDGTLVDTEPLHLAKFAGVAKNNGITLSEDELEAMRGVADKSVWKYLKASKGLKISLDDFYDECYDYYMAHPEEIVPREGAKEAFNHFASKRFRKPRYQAVFALRWITACRNRASMIKCCFRSAPMMSAKQNRIRCLICRARR